MREILFRGKSNSSYGKVKKGDWLYSMTIQPHCSTDTEITSYYIGGGNNTIDGKTLGQYTGLTDKNGTKIFEGDIVVMNIKGYNTICKVAWADNVAQFQLWQTNTIPHTPTALNLGNYDCEIIGNIHDNPELLKELGK